MRAAAATFGADRRARRQDLAGDDHVVLGVQADDGRLGHGVHGWVSLSERARFSPGAPSASSVASARAASAASRLGSSSPRRSSSGCATTARWPPTRRRSRTASSSSPAAPPPPPLAAPRPRQPAGRLALGGAQALLAADQAAGGLGILQHEDRDRQVKLLEQGRVQRLDLLRRHPPAGRHAAAAWRHAAAGRAPSRRRRVPARWRRPAPPRGRRISSSPRRRAGCGRGSHAPRGAAGRPRHPVGRRRGRHRGRRRGRPRPRPRSIASNRSAMRSTSRAALASATEGVRNAAASR